ncbi:MAG TPA: alpha/beta hydrolase [Verrucomicrobiae bacterium]|nr:alpha/beta hydrolase [Verrucomicrobiae bacterium]
MQKIIWAAAAILLILLVAGIIIAWRRPLAVTAWLNRRTLAKAGFTKTHLSSPVGTQTVFISGKGQTIILLHGAGDQAGAWAKVAPALIGKYRVVIPDLAGHGDSDPKSGPLSVRTVLAGIEAIASAESGRVTIVGNSLGGWIASLYAQKHPEKVERLVLVNGGPLIGDRPDITLTPKTREEARKTIAAMFDPGSFQLPDYVVDDIVREAQTGALMRLSETANEMPKYLLEGRLNEITVPVNLVWGESDHVLSLNYAKRMQSQLPNAQLVTLKRCGHAPQLECPKAFTAKLTEVLQSPLSPQPVGAEAK